MTSQLVGSITWGPHRETPTAVEPAVCRFCGKPADHPITRCPMVRAVEFYGDGQVRRVELVR